MEAMGAGWEGPQRCCHPPPAASGGLPLNEEWRAEEGPSLDLSCSAEALLVSAVEVEVLG